MGKYPSSFVHQWDNFEVHGLHCLPEPPNGVKFQLPTGVTCLVTQPLSMHSIPCLTFPLIYQCFLAPLSQTNHLYLKPLFWGCFWGNPTWAWIPASDNQDTEFKSIWPKCHHLQFLPWSKWRTKNSLGFILRPPARTSCVQEGGGPVLAAEPVGRSSLRGSSDFLIRLFQAQDFDSDPPDTLQQTSFPLVLSRAGCSHLHSRSQENAGLHSYTMMHGLGTKNFGIGIVFL